MALGVQTTLFRQRTVARVSQTSCRPSGEMAAGRCPYAKSNRFFTAREVTRLTRWPQGARISVQAVENIVSTRYYISMLEQSTAPEQTVAELVEQLGRCACSEAFSAGLNPAQWSALRYFDRANRFSCTVSAFAQYHDTTRGTASQTVRALVQKGYLRRRPANHDQRSFRLDLTERARQVLHSDPFGEFVSAAGALPPEQCSALARGLRAMLKQVLDKRARRPFGVCTSCEHLGVVDGEGEGGCGYHCRLQDELLRDQDLGRICVDYRCRKDH